MFSGKHLGMSCYSIPAIVVSQQLRGGHGWSDPHSKKIHSWGELSLKTWKRVKQRIHRQEWRRAGKVHIGRCDLGCPVPWVVGTELRKTANEEMNPENQVSGWGRVWTGLVMGEENWFLKERPHIWIFFSSMTIFMGGRIKHMLFDRLQITA